MDNIKSDNHSLPPLPAAEREQLLEGKWKPNWKPETWGGPRSGSGRPTLGGEEDPTVTVTVMMPRSLKEEAIRLGDGNMSGGIRKAIAFLAFFPVGKPAYTNAPQWYEAVDARPRSHPQPAEE